MSHLDYWLLIFGVWRGVNIDCVFSHIYFNPRISNCPNGPVNHESRSDSSGLKIFSFLDNATKLKRQRAESTYHILFNSSAWNPALSPTPLCVVVSIRRISSTRSSASTTLLHAFSFFLLAIHQTVLKLSMQIRRGNIQFLAIISILLMIILFIRHYGILRSGLSPSFLNYYHPISCVI